MKIDPQIAASAINRYTRTAGRPAAAAVGTPADRVEISDRAQLYTSLLKAARQPDDASEARMHAIVNRLASASPALDLDRLAARMMGLSAGDASDTGATGAIGTTGDTGATADAGATGIAGRSRT